DCIMLYMAKDIYTIKYFIENMDENEELTAEQRKSIQKQDIRRLNKMVDYCNTAGCLRANILRYFGEYSLLECGNCSSCNGAEKRREKREKITFAKARASLEGQQPKQDKKPSKSPAVLSTAKERELFEKLRLARLNQSRIQGVPPYVIFSDRTIIDICKRLPMTQEELLAVDGIGSTKAERYGKMIINEVKQFVK
ncbi:MAG: HRDC domain-containing protein, partial [Candidatus Ornithomonoglobus sp.]